MLGVEWCSLTICSLHSHVRMTSEEILFVEVVMLPRLDKHQAHLVQYSPEQQREQNSEPTSSRCHKSGNRYGSIV